jgi:signal transduction histidine kinase
VSFRYRLGLFLVVMLLAVQALTVVLTYGAIRNSLIEGGKRQLATSTTALMKQLEVLGERIGDDVEVLSLDYALRKAVAEHDPETALSALRNHGNRIGAARMLLVELDGKIGADTGGRFSAGATFPFPELIQRASAGEQATALAVLDGGLYWIVVVPVRAPVPIAFITACVPVDDALLDRLAQLSSLSQSMALAMQSRSGWTVVARTSGYSPGQINLPSEVNTSTAILASAPNAGHVTMIAHLATAPSSPAVLAVFDYPLDQTLNTWAVLRPMLLVLMGALGLALAASVLIARGVSRPLELLAAAARRIAQGDYAPIPQLGRSDEVADLAIALDGMTRAVAERETALKDAILSLETATFEAVKANEAKSQFLSNMSHELRTPLNAIVGFAEMISGEALGPVGIAKYAEYATDIHESGLHLSAQFEQMLGLAQAESGQLKLARRPFAPGHLLYAVVKNLSAMAEQAGVMLDIKGDLRSLPYVEGDEAKLQMSFANLIHNAIKFSPRGTIVTIAGARAGRMLEVIIADRGAGIRPEDLPLVSRPFYRGMRAYDARHQGAGLGLPFAKKIVELHGGSLEIESNPGIGTTVTVSLPSALVSGPLVGAL